MRSRILAGRVLLVPVSGLVLMTAACSSSPATSTPPASSASSSVAAPSSGATSPAAGSSSMAAEPTSGSGAVSAITANWEAFFSGKTPAATKIALLQNGQAFAQIINAQAGSPMSQSAKATVTSVTINGTTATVKYNIGISGAGLNDQTGKAVYENGVWKVGDVSFCSLLTLENGGQPPSVCKSAS